VQFSIDNGATWNPIATGLPGTATSTTWSIPANLVPADQTQVLALVRVVSTDAAGQQAIDQSDGPFTVRAPQTPLSVRVLSPNGGETVTAGQSLPIQWTVTGASQQRVQFSIDNGATWNPIATGLPGTATSTTWSIPSNLVPFGLSQVFALVRVVATDATGLQAIDASNGSFTILAP
jgi:hypothetical protein